MQGLVNCELWSKDNLTKVDSFGDVFTELRQLRHAANYGQDVPVQPREARFYVVAKSEKAFDEWHGSPANFEIEVVFFKPWDVPFTFFLKDLKTMNSLEWVPHNHLVRLPHWETNHKYTRKFKQALKKVFSHITDW